MGQPAASVPLNQYLNTLDNALGLQLQAALSQSLGIPLNNVLLTINANLAGGGRADLQRPREPLDQGQVRHPRRRA